VEQEAAEEAHLPRPHARYEHATPFIFLSFFLFILICYLFGPCSDQERQASGSFAPARRACRAGNSSRLLPFFPPPHAQLSSSSHRPSHSTRHSGSRRDRRSPQRVRDPPAARALWQWTASADTRHDTTRHNDCNVVPSQLRLIDYLGTNRKTGTLLERFGYGRYADAALLFPGCVLTTRSTCACRVVLRVSCACRAHTQGEVIHDYRDHEKEVLLEPLQSA